jgi:hypothetical protein
VQRGCEEQGSYGEDWNSKTLGVPATPAALAEKYTKFITDEFRLAKEEREAFKAACEEGFEKGLARADK